MDVGAQTMVTNVLHKRSMHCTNSCPDRFSFFSLTGCRSVFSSGNVLKISLIILISVRFAIIFVTCCLNYYVLLKMHPLCFCSIVLLYSWWCSLIHGWLHSVIVFVQFGSGACSGGCMLVPWDLHILVAVLKVCGGVSQIKW